MRQRIARRSDQHEFSQVGVTVPAHDDHVGLRHHRSFLQSGRDAALADRLLISTENRPGARGFSTEN